MGSFTDAISQFNPYVQQLPVELMAKVGMQKQAQYDAGVQKIQQQVDNVAGLDVVHDADKAYLQSKLGELGNNLKTFSAADFSNQQLVNTVGGMTSSLVKDPTIQNAVASTAWYKKQKAELDKAYKEGKSSVANVDDFNTQAEQWLSSKEPGQLFRGRYSPYIDVDKHNLEVFKALHSSETGKDFIKERFTDPITGKLLSTNKLAAAMEREGIEGISAAKIETALRSSITPDILNQMRIDANYQFKGVTPEQLSARAQTQYMSSLQRTDEEIERLEGIAALSDAQPILKKRALDSIEQLKNNKLKLSENYNQQLENIYENPDRAKLDIYKEGTIDQFANAFSWEKRTTQVLANPQFNAQLDAERLQVQKATLRLSQRSQKWQEYMDTRKQDFEEMKWSADKAPADPFLTVLGQHTDKLPSPLTAIAQSTIDANSDIERNISTLFQNNPELKNNRAELQKRLIAFQNGDDSQFSGNMRSTAQAILDNRKRIRENAKIEEFAKSEVESDPEVRRRKQQLEQDLSKMPGTIITVGGKQIKLTANELFNINKKAQDILGGVGTESGTYASDNLTSREKEVLDLAFPPGDSRAFNPKLSDDLKKQLFKFNPIVDSYRSYVNDVDNRVNGLLSKRAGRFAPMLENIDTSKPAVRATYEGIVGSILTRYIPGVIAPNTKGGDMFLSPEDVTKAKSWFSGEGRNDIQYKNVKMGDSRYIMMMKGDESVLIKMTPQEASQPALRSTIDTYGQDVLQKQEWFRGSTNPTGKVEDAQFQRNFFKNVRKYPIVADLKNDPQTPESNYINLQIKIGNTWQPIQLDKNPMQADKARGILANWTDEDTERILKSNGISIK